MELNSETAAPAITKRSTQDVRMVGATVAIGAFQWLWRQLDSLEESGWNMALRGGVTIMAGRA